MFRFWYRFIPDTMSLIQRGQAELAYQRILPQIPAFMGAVFEDICMQYLWRLNIEGKTPFPFLDAGRWWGNNPQKRKECEIDIIADNKEDMIFAECKWTNEAAGPDVLDILVERSDIFKCGRKRSGRKYYYMFAKTGFTAELQSRAAQMGNVSLIRFAELNQCQ